MTALALKLRSGPLAVVVALGLVAALFAWQQIETYLATRSGAHPLDMARLILFYSTLPRMATALLCGAALALSGALLQQVLRNPLASPTTLGISSGASLALSLAMLFAPSLMTFSSDLVALAGSVMAAALVFLIGARRGFSPFSLVLSGLVVSLWCGALSAVLLLMNDRYLDSLFIWGAGSLAQQSWDIPLSLLPKLAVIGGFSLLIIRPLGLLDLGESGATALGVRIGHLRFWAVAAAVALTAVVTSAVGVIGFIGLVAPVIARMAGARRPMGLLVWSSLIGAALLWLTDGAVQVLAGATAEFLPTGAVTAIFGSPLLLLLLPKLKTRHRISTEPVHVVQARPNWLIPLVSVALIGVLLGSLFLGREATGDWAWLSAAQWPEIMPLRLPRVLAALASGAMLAVAGTMLQRLTGNEMASPEVLGISAGATLGMALALILFSASGLSILLVAASLGALTVLAAIVVFGMRSGFAPERVLLAGIALGAMVDAIVGIYSTSGDPRALFLLRWMSGSTYSVDRETSIVLCALGAVLVTAVLFMRRWLDILPLGPTATVALGVPLSRARFSLYFVAALLTAAATLAVGPLSFIGLMAPHLARECGLRRALPHMIGAALIGAGLMMLADWAGRMLIFPYQIPAGLVSALMGAPFLVLLLGRRTAR
jgi:ABC-type Fe3+-siderophore transport system permease subunit